MTLKPFSQLTPEEKREYQKLATQRSRARKRPQDLEDQLEAAIADRDASGPRIHDLLDEIYWLRKKEQEEFLVGQLENPTPEQGDDIDEACSEWLLPYENRGPCGPGGTHDLGKWSFTFMKKRLSETKLGRLLLARYGNDEATWTKNRPGQQNAA